MFDQDGGAQAHLVRFGETEVDVRALEVRRSGAVQPVEPQVFDVLVHLIRHRDQVVTKEQLLDAVWGSRFVSESALTTRIKAARRAVGDNGRDQRIIRTYHGRGYRFVAEVEHEPAAAAPARREDRLLLERDDELAELAAAFEAATTGSSGAIALVSGDAGIGKSSLVREFTASVRGSARVLAGACDDLFTPRSLGPFHDMVPSAGPDVAAALAAMDREGLLSALGGLLGDGRPTVFVVEDAHWADDATLDVLRWLLRRLVDHRGLVVLTYRSTDVASGHPLQRLLGSVPASIAHRIELPALGLEAIASLMRAAGRDLDAQELARVTDGNPFFVTEVLADARADIPASVVDAVIARLHAAPVETVKALLICSVIPGTIDIELAAALLGDVQVLDEAERRGMLIADREGIRFRHDLARRAIEGSLTDLLRLSSHRRVLEQLLALDAPPSQLVHHAAGAGDIEALLEHGVRAAREAVATGARRQAAEHLAVVLDHADRLEPGEEALLRASHAYELFLLNELAAAEAEARHAVQLAEGLTDPLMLAEALATLLPLARLFDLWDGGASEMGRRAIELLGDDPPPALEATACVNLASDLVLIDQHGEAASWTERGLAAARRAGRKDLESLCLMYQATSKGWLGDPQGEADLREAIERAEVQGAWDYAARGCHNMVGMLFRQARLAEVPPWIDRAVTDSEEAEFFSGLARARSMRGGLNLYHGRWDEAEAELRELTTADEPRVLSWLPLALLGRLLARRGNPEAAQVLARAEDAIAGLDDPQRLLTVRAARVEHAWLAGDDDEARALAAGTLGAIGSAYHPQLRGELLRYVQRAGGTSGPGDGCSLPYALALGGDFRGAADVWQAIDFPFELALELADVGGPRAAVEAITILDRLGACPAAERVRDRVRRRSAEARVETVASDEA
ncbi:MAG TPA: AAA family ATPase [Acidimicrobiales bacterium]|nr:AAA family ATPase [Acidimicrobiales bacterium]